MTAPDFDATHDDREQPPRFMLTRRHFLGYGGALMGSALLGACGGGTDTPPSPGSSSPGGTAMPADPIWGPAGAATNIIASLDGIRQAAFRAVDFEVEAYGAQPCSVVTQTSPYTDAGKSPVSPGAGATQGAGAFDSRPAFLAAISACAAAGGGRVVVPAGDWYCAGP
ncbi:endopolygalacturonase, partial [Burkholderia gladioli]|nr:endopolygalacturonase [Burkholderia gladioli]